MCVLCDKDGIKWVRMHPHVFRPSVRRHVTVLLFFCFEEVSDTARLPLLLLFFLTPLHLSFLHIFFPFMLDVRTLISSSIKLCTIHTAAKKVIGSEKKRKNVRYIYTQIIEKSERM